MKIKAAVINEFGKPADIEEIDLAEPRANEVRVRMVSSGICGTDLGLRADGCLGMDRAPVVPGHEGAGVIEKTGPGVVDFKPGDKVVISYPTCGHCMNCRQGMPWDCDNVLGLIHGGTMEDGTTLLSREGKPVNMFFGASTLATHLVTNTRNLAKVDVETEEELVNYAPLACGLMAGAGAVLNYLKPDPGDPIVVFGAGTIGLSAVAGARISRCAPVICVDLNPQRLDLAKEFGADYVINPSEVDDVAAEVKRLTGGKGAKFAVDGIGNETIVQQMYDSTMVPAKLAFVSVSVKVEFKGYFFSMLGKQAHAINMGDADPAVSIPQLAKWHQKGLFPFEKMITYYTLDQVNEAMDDCAAGRVIKPVIRF